MTFYVRHQRDDNGSSLCGREPDVPLSDLFDSDVPCWDCEDIAASTEEIESPFAATEQAVWNQLSKIPYRDYLQTHHWRWIREAALDYYGRACLLCGSIERIQVHHRTYDRRGHERLCDLTVLCGDCHASYHRAA